MHAKFDHFSFSHSGDMVGALQNLNGSRDLTTPLTEMVCHPWTGAGLSAAAQTCLYIDFTL